MWAEVHCDEASSSFLHNNVYQQILLDILLTREPKHARPGHSPLVRLGPMIFWLNIHANARVMKHHHSSSRLLLVT